MEVVTVDFRGGGDGVLALYVGGNLYKYGDEYHDKIEDYIRGFVDGLKFILGIAMTYEKITLHQYHPLIDKVCSEGYSPPEKLIDIDVDENLR